MQEMKIVKIMALLLTALPLLTACSADDGGTGGSEIQLTATVGGSETRAAVMEYLYQGATCHVWADETDPTTQDVVNTDYITDWQLTATMMGLLDAGRNNKRVYPLVNWMNLYGLVGNFTPAFVKSHSPYPTEAVTHQIADDQTTEADYNRSDLLYGSAYDVEPESYAVLTFYHMLTQIQLALVPAGYLTKADLEAATVELLGMPTTVSFTPTKLSATDMADPTKRALLVEAGTETGSIKMSAAANEYGATDGFAYATAIVAPHTISSGSLFVKVTCKGNDYYYETTADKTLESGKSYRFVLTLTDGTLKLTEVTGYGPDVDGGYDWDLFWLNKTPDYESETGNPEGFSD